MHLLRQVKQVITQMEQRIMTCATPGSVTATHQTLAQREMGMEMALVDIPIVTYDPAIWANPTAACDPPCIMVLPPINLGEPTTISLPPITTFLEVGGVGATDHTPRQL